MKKHILLAFAMILASASGLLAQKVWTEPETDIDPEDTLKIYIDLSQMDCDKLLGTTDPVYLWSWMPADPVNGNGDWSNSNTDNEWESIGGDIYRFTMIPTEFYGVDAQTVYDNDISFLAKSLDGGSGGDCSAAGDENKTEDLMVAVDPPIGKAGQGIPLPQLCRWRFNGTDPKGRLHRLLRQFHRGQGKHAKCRGPIRLPNRL